MNSPRSCLKIGMLTMLLAILPACSGGVGGGGAGGQSNDNENQNQNQNDNENTNENQNLNDNSIDGNENLNGNENSNDNGSDNENDNGSGSGAALTALIAGLPAGDAQVGEQFQLVALVTNDVGDLEYEWGVDQAGLATLSASTVSSPILTLIGAGLLEIILSVTDTATGESTKDVFQLTITVPAPPAGAAIQVLDPDFGTQLVPMTLIVQTSGPAPISLAWEPDPDNIFISEALLFLDLGSGLATFTPPQFPTQYDLTFHVLAVYDNGATLTATLVVTVFS